MEMQFKNEIKKLADIVVWADDWIEELKTGLTEEELEEDTGIEEFETVKKVVLESIDRHAVYTNALNKDIADKAAKIELLEKEIDGYEEENARLTEKIKLLEKEIDGHEEENARLTEKIKELKETIKRQKEGLALQERIREKEDHVKYWKEAFETQATSLAEVRKCNDELVGTLNKSSDRVEELEKQVKYLEKELNETYTYKELDLKGHNRREMALVNDLADKNDEIKKLKEEIEGRKKAFNDLREETANRYIAIETHNDICKTYEKDVDYWKNQERIRTDQLRATESKVEELWKEIEKFTKGEDDNHGKSGFKRYIEHLIEEEERAVPERFKERLNKEITEIFTKKEETEVNGIPCGEDSIE